MKPPTASSRTTARLAFAPAAAVAALVWVLAQAACISELGLPASDFEGLYVDGALLVDSVGQRLRLGRTDGLRRLGTPVSGAIVEVTDLTTGRVYPYTEDPFDGGHYAASFAAELGHAYRLTVGVPDVGTYRSQPDSLTAADVEIAAEAQLQTRLDREGVAQVRRAAGARLAIRNDGGAAGVLTLRPVFVWAYTDGSCSPFDAREKCYFEEDEPGGPFGVVDLSLIRAGDTAGVFLGGEVVDFRMAEEAYFFTQVFRYSAAAAPYFRAVSQALNPSGTPLDERPRPVAGNMRAEGDAEPMLGYFGVVASTPVLVGTAGVTGITARAGVPICVRPRDAPADLDCCTCASTPGALTRRPAYLP